MTPEGTFQPITEDHARSLMRDKHGEFIVRQGEHVIFKDREFVVDAITEETLTIRPVRQVTGGRTLPGPIPSQRLAP